MKVRISATINEETNENLEKILKRGKHRNKSHIVEDAINYYIKEKLNEK